MAKNKNLIKLSPAYMETVWGGNRLKYLKNDPSLDNKLIGESWEVSIHKDGPSTFNGVALSSDITFPYLVKFIDTSDNLSVQVHPDDEYANIHENSSGKTECWLILDAAPGEGIYLGLKEGTTQELFEEGLRHKKNMQEYLQFHEVNRGDFFYVPAGSIHAIGRNVTLCEIQQSSGITYRVWDWNRIDINGKSRELHIDKALDVINFDPARNTSSNFKIKKSVLSNNDGIVRVIEHPQFICDVITLGNDDSLILCSEQERPSAIIVLEGSVTISVDGEFEQINEYNSLLVLSSNHNFKITASEKACFIWVS